MVPGHGKKGVCFVLIKRYSFDVSNCFGFVGYAIQIAPGMQGSVQAWKIYVVQIKCNIHQNSLRGSAWSRSFLRQRARAADALSLRAVVGLV
jgi:hypothetical protein